jgi:hypothetical protein
MDIEEIFALKKYRFLFQLDESYVNNYFLAICETGEKLNVIIKLLDLCDWLDKISAILICVKHGNINGFTLIVKVLKASEIENKIKFADDIIAMFYSRNNQEEEKLLRDFTSNDGEQTDELLLEEYISVLLARNIISPDDIFIVACKQKSEIIARKIISHVDVNLLIELFTELYQNNYYHKMIPYIYKYIKHYVCPKLGPCKNADLLHVFNFEEFYMFDDQIDYIVDQQDYYMLEILAIIAPQKYNLDVRKIEPLFAKMPSSLLKLLRKKFTLENIFELSDSSQAKFYSLDWKIAKFTLNTKK